MGRHKDSHKRKRSRRDSSSHDDSSQSDSRSSSEESDHKERVAKRKHKKKSKHSKKPKLSDISMDDYFLKSAEFRTWLSKERGVFFSELSSEESRKLFGKFVSKWNKGLLSKRYYEGIQSSAVSHDTQSKYKWKLSSVDSGELKSVRESVGNWSRGDSTGTSTSSTVKSIAGPSIGPAMGPPPSIGPAMGPPRGPSDSLYERETTRDAHYSKLKRDRKDFRKQQDMVLDELLPKATGKQAAIEKKWARAAERRSREYSPEISDPCQAAPKDSIQRRIKSMKDKRELKASSAVQKISDYKAKEKAKMDAILEMARASKKEGAMW